MTYNPHIGNASIRKKILGGFTLIETLFAVLILAIALTGPLTIAAKAFNSALVAKDQTIAFFLAQDAVEYIRFKRDTTALRNEAWLTGLSACFSASNPHGCYIDSRQDTIAACASSGCPSMRFNTAEGWYSYSSGDNATIFTRTVTLATVANNADEENLTVKVTWRDVGNVLRSVTVREDITDWQ